MRSVLDRVLLIFTIALVVLGGFFAIAAVFVPNFQQGGSAIAGVILGALTAGLGSVLTAGYVTREIRNQEADASRDSASKEEKNE